MSLELDSLKETDWATYEGPNDTEINIAVRGGDEQTRKEVLRTLNKLVTGNGHEYMTVKAVFVDSSD